MMNEISSVMEVLDEYLICGDEFDGLIKQIIENSNDDITGIRYSCIQLKEEDAYCPVYGIEGEGRATSTKTFDAGNDVEVTVSLWCKKERIKEETAVQLFRKFWNTDYTNNRSGILSNDKADSMRKCQNTLVRNAENKKKTAVFMIDLDQLKEINDGESHSKGDRVIRLVTNAILRANKNKGIVIHRSGDEFLLLYTYEKYTDVVELGWNISRTIKEYTSRLVQKTITAAIGIQLLESNEMDFQEALDKAEGLYNPARRNSTKQRYSIRIGKKDNENVHNNGSYELAVSRVFSNIFYLNIFRNIYLDYLSVWMSEIKTVEDCQKEINDFLEWLNPEWGITLRCAESGKKWDTLPALSLVEVGLAIFHGLMNNKCLENKEVEIDFGKNPKHVLEILVDGSCIYESQKTIENSEYQKCIKKKIPVYLKRNNADLDISKKIVLLLAGYDMGDIPEDLFYKVVKVDNRPNIGGGLPDLWAASLCELISDMNSNPNFTDIIVFGDTDNTKKIKRYLENIKNWGEENSNEFSFDYIARKTYKSNSDITAFKNKFKDKIYFAVSEKKLIEHTFLLYSKDDIDYTNKICVKTDKPKRFLKRNLDYKNIRLKAYDGCVAQSLADAFPMVLEILRRRYNSDSKKYRKIVDQAKRELLELTNFKITLRSPNKDSLPDYYSSDKEELDQYYNAVFGDRQGLFRKYLEENNQLEAMFHHVVTAIADYSKRYATRRAILVVPNPGNLDENYSPLGLVSIWLSPRFAQNEEKVIIDFSYTWRTVEALVGLPLSMYASEKFADYLTQEIEKRVTDSGSRISVKMGQISYIAYSLHMFLDEESMNIVREIVNEASI